jgi:hypothetical protein
MSVEFKVAHRKLLERALKALGWTFNINALLNEVVAIPKSFGSPITINLATGKATLIEEQQLNLNSLKRAYSKEALRQVARLNSWTLNLTNATKGQLMRGVL